MLTWMIGPWNHHESRWLSAIEVLAVWLGQALASQSWKNGVYLDPWKSLGLDMGLMPYGSRLCTLCTFWCESQWSQSLYSLKFCPAGSYPILPIYTNTIALYRVSDVGLEFQVFYEVLDCPNSPLSCESAVLPPTWSPLLVWLCQTSFSVLRNSSVFCICPFLYVISFFCANIFCQR